MENSRNNKLFEIEDYNISEEEIEVIAFKNNEEKNYTIDRQKFENWLRFNDKLDYCLDWADYAGEHQQETGQMSLDEYWESSRECIKEDLYDYIIIKIEGEKVFDVFWLLGKIFNPTLARNFKALLIAILLPVFAFSKDTIHVKKVFLNGHKIKVKSGYIIHKSSGWEVNGKDVKLYAYKPTNNPDFKPQPDSLTAKK